MSTSDVMRFRPTGAGVAIIVALVVAASIEGVQVAVGFFVPLFLLGAADLLVSYRELRVRQVSILLLSKTVASPNPFAFSVSADPGRLALAVQMPALSLAGTRAARAVIPATGGAARVEQPDGDPEANHVYRWGVSTSWLGLTTVARWHVTPVPGGMFRSVAPRPTDVTPPPLVDDVARLREYVPGDRMSRVAWPTTARTGRLHVRAEGFGIEEILLRVDIGSPLGLAPAARRAILQQAADCANELLEQGAVVKLVARVYSEAYYEAIAHAARKRPNRPVMLTARVEGDELLVPGPHVVNTDVRTSVVSTRDELHRALAVIAPGPPLPAPEGPSLQVDASGVREIS